jgi:hypothetical protein
MLTGNLGYRFILFFPFPRCSHIVRQQALCRAVWWSEQERCAELAGGLERGERDNNKLADVVVKQTGHVVGNSGIAR